MRKLLNILVVWGAAMAIAACGNSSSNELKDGKAVAVPEVNEVEVVTLMLIQTTQIIKSLIFILGGL